MSPKDYFHQAGALHVKDVLSHDVAMLLSHCLMRVSDYQDGRRDDEQVPGALGIMDHEVLFETVQERVWTAVENVIGEELIPTYSYARLYTNGNTLEKHTDRPSCEISMTVQLGRSHHYAWPIHMGSKRFDLGEGDGVIYKGCDVEHWRNVCDGPEGYVSGQAFFHYVRKNGSYAGYAGDNRYSDGRLPFVRGRHLILGEK